MMREMISNPAIQTVLVGVVALAINYVVYLARVREVRLTANERLMRMVIDIDREMIAHPQLMWLTRPDEFPSPDAKDPMTNAQLRAFMYMHLNMFDVAFNYYNVTLNMNWLNRKLLLSREEIDHWEGWKTYMSWFIRIPFVAEIFQREAYLWYGPRFRTYLLELSRTAASSLESLSKAHENGR
jgi:hypothetical protein